MQMLCSICLPSILPSSSGSVDGKSPSSWRKTWRHLEHLQAAVSPTDCSTIIMNCPRWQRVRSTRRRRRHLKQPASLLLAGRLSVSCFKMGIKPKPSTVQLAVRHPSAGVCIGPVYWSGRFFTFWAKGNTTPLWSLLSTAETDRISSDGSTSITNKPYADRKTLV